MDQRPRSRSPAVAHIRRASPHPPVTDPSDCSSAYTVDATAPHLADHRASFAALNSSGAFGDPTFTQEYPPQFSLGSTFAPYDHQQVQQRHLDSQGGAVADHAFLQSQGLHDNAATNGESTAFPSFDFSETNFDQDASLDPSLLSTDLDILSQGTGTNQINPTLDPMATTMSSHSPTPPHIFADMGRRQSGSPSPHASPSFPQANTNFFLGLNRPRNASESLDPSSAMFPQGNEWMGMGGYRSHKRTPSDQHSDISSNNASPYMGTLDSFDVHSSPMLNPTNDPTFNDGLGLQLFNLNENGQYHHSHSPGHSPGHSPHLMPQPQHALPAFTAENNFGLNTTMNGSFAPQQNGLEMFPGLGQEPFPSMSNHGSPGDMGQADHMSPPEINIDYAPPPPQIPMENSRPETQQDALSPPLRTTNRARAKSDSNVSSRSASPALIGRGRSPSAGGETLSPFPGANKAVSRSPSPANRGRNGSDNRARSSSNASDHRDYILDLADPKRTPSNGADKGRIQKHPATFQCTLCPKRFTRAYNLRSHLRTHTDERPFVCTVCGKAFARQHDRKRHEGLHSGEKKFVCRGTLQSTSQWGCGRRFARADALGRHFRSEAGRVCIKPLLDEEAADRQKVWMAEQQQAQLAAGLAAPQPMMVQPQMDMMNNLFPAALLAQYPALQNIDWNNVPQGPPPDEEAYSGRSSYDASSGGEFYEDVSENEMGNYSDSNMSGMNNMSMEGMNHMGMQAPTGNQQNFQYGGNQAGDFLGDFEGR